MVFENIQHNYWPETANAPESESPVETVFNPDSVASKFAVLTCFPLKSVLYTVIILATSDPFVPEPFPL